MHLTVLLIAACFVVVRSYSKRHYSTTVGSSIIEPTVTTESLINLDESLSRCGPFQIDIRELTILQFQDHFQSGKLTSKELTECYLYRISKIDVHLKSVIEINREAIFLASKADRERNAGLNRSPMHGIPILIKDNIGTTDSMQTTAGAKALENVKPKQDADVVHRLRKAGAIILGKTNPSEWAKDDDIPSGWSGRGGQTICPYVLGKDPSGSSTGSAVSIAANMAAISLGTETDGSIISPSDRNGLVGLKTTIGKVSTRGVIPLSFSNDVVGPMARSVTDAAILMGIISDIDFKGCSSDVSTCLPNQNLKIGVFREPFWNATDPAIKANMPVLEACLDKLRTNKLALVIDPVICPIPITEIRGEDENMIFAHEFKLSINHYLRNDVYHYEMGRKIFSLADVIEYNERNPGIEGYNQNVLKFSQSTDGLLNRTYLNTRNEIFRNSITILELTFEKYGVDALAAPCSSEDTSDLHTYGAFAGYPSITVPIGIDDTGLPFGLCLIGKFGSEPVLLKLGYFIELSRSTGRPTPRFAKES